MMIEPGYNPNRPEDAMATDPLPAEIGPVLRRLDARVAQLATIRAALPAGLSDRVYEASVEGLPRQVYPMPTAEPVRRRRSLYAISWGRLAMAASLGLAFLVASTFVRTSSFTDRAVAREIEYMLLEPGEDEVVDVAYLLDTWDISSVEDLTLPENGGSADDDLEM